MRNILTTTLLMVFIFGASAFKMKPADDAGKVKWYSWEEAVEANKTNKKKIFVDMYTDWCGWGKRMDKTTFADKRVAAYLNKHYYPVKFDAEQKEEIQFKGHTFAYKDYGRRGYHELALALLDGKLSYPTSVFLTEDFVVDQRLPGYLDADKMLMVLQYIAEEKDKPNPMPWKEFQRRYNEK